MKTFFKIIKSKKTLVVIATVIVGVILINTYQFFEGFKNQEKIKMEILADAYFQFNKAKPNDDISLLVKIIENNNSIPMIVTDQEGTIILNQNIKFSNSSKEEFLAKKLKEMKELHPPIVIDLSKNKTQYIYYATSEILNKLRYYPLALIFIFIVFLGVVYLVITASSVSDKNKLWIGMAKETAHQIGTPLSSLLGWIAILRLEDIDQTYVDEIEKDVEHLSVIANRFSKIGSKPDLKPCNLIDIVDDKITYFKARSSRSIIFHFTKPSFNTIIPLNKDLFGWVLENIIKNAIDAMQGKGSVNIQIIDKNLELQLLITDTGKGIPKKSQKNIFEPGYTTKERGWGLGLSLTNRIITKYHKGKVFVKQSQKNTGTTFQINIPKKIKLPKSF